MMLFGKGYLAPVRLRTILYVTDVNVRLKTWVRNNETLRVCGRFQKAAAIAVDVSQKPLNSIQMQPNVLTSIRVKSWWEADGGGLQEGDGAPLVFVSRCTCSPAAALGPVSLLSVACNQLLFPSLRRSLGWAEERAHSLSQHVQLQQWRDHSWRSHISSHSPNQMSMTETCLVCSLILLMDCVVDKGVLLQQICTLYKNWYLILLFLDIM